MSIFVREEGSDEVKYPTTSRNIAASSGLGIGLRPRSRAEGTAVDEDMPTDLGDGDHVPVVCRQASIIEGARY